MNNFIDTYFTSDKEYPSASTLARGLGDSGNEGMWFKYVSSTYLTGLINYVKIEAAFCLSRYYRWDDTIDREVNIMDPPNSFNWTKVKGTKQEVFDLLTEKGRVFHSKLDNDFQDDLLILSILEDSPNTYVLFWFDRDCSDSCVGMFRASNRDQVLSDFKQWAISPTLSNNADEVAKEVPVHYFNGWLTS